MSSVFYEELKPAEFLERLQAFPVAYLPLGTLEWHGLHLPLGSDALQAKGVLAALAREVGGIVLPPLFVGPGGSAISKDGAMFYGMDNRSFAEEHPQQLEGSAYYIEDELFERLLDTILQDLARAGFSAVVAHGHGPSTKAFAARQDVFAQRFGLVTRTLWDLGYTGPEGIQTDHAAENETSLVMALHPELVDMDRIARDEVPVGIWGRDPRRTASAELGERLIRQNVALAAANLRELARTFPSPRRGLQYHHVKNLISE